MAEFIYTLRKARKAHGDKVVLDDVTLSFLPGAKIGVVGPNGCGKTRLLDVLSGRLAPQAGEVRRMQACAYLDQRLSRLQPGRTVMEQLQDACPGTPVDVLRTRLADSEVGLRLRYEVRREFAPYVGFTWHRSYGQTAQYARDEGEDASQWRWVAGVRLWF